MFQLQSGPGHEAVLINANYVRVGGGGGGGGGGGDWGGGGGGGGGVGGGGGGWGGGTLFNWEAANQNKIYPVIRLYLRNILY